MTEDIQNKMKEDVRTYEDLGNLIGLCLDNFEIVILPKLPVNKTTEKELPKEADLKINLPKIIQTFVESSDETMILRDFRKSKAEKEDAEKEDDFSDLFDHCLQSYKETKHTSLEKEKNPEVVKNSSIRRKTLSKSVLENNFRKNLKNETFKRNATNGKVKERSRDDCKNIASFSSQLRQVTSDSVQHFENKQNKTEKENKDPAVNTQKKNNMKKSALKNTLRSEGPSKRLERSLPKKRLLGQ